MDREGILWLLKHKLNTFECFRDDNIRAHEKYRDEYFKGKADAFDIVVHNLNNVIDVIQEEEE